MAGINTAIQLDDRMSPVLTAITDAMNLMYISFSSVQNAVDSGIDTTGMEATRQAIVNVSTAAAEYQEQLARLSQTSAAPPEPAWQRTESPEVIMNTGVERFTLEMQSANQMAERLSQTQQEISMRASQMNVVPPGMMEDMNSVNGRIQDLRNRLQELNNTPVELRTERTSNEIESIRLQLNRAVEAQGDLNSAVNRMDISAANAAYQRLNSIVDSTRQDIRNNTSAQEQFNRSMQNGHGMADGLKNRIKQFIGMYLSVQGIKMAVQFVGDATSLQNVQNEAETKLQTIMQQRMGAPPEAIQSIKDLASAQQQLGVVGDEVQLSGAQQLATFLNSTDALSSLIPAMNNLAVQQNGVNVSAQDMVNIGNMMGKVMQGQVGALTRVGVTFTEAQEKVLKYGNEQDRAATLAQVITDNVGNMNAVMASTPQGQIQQMANTWGDIKEVVGAKLYPAVMRFFDSVNTNMPIAENAVMGLAGVLNILITGFSYVVDAAGTAAGFIQDNWSWLAPIIGGVATAVVLYAGVLTAFNIAQGISNGLKTLSVINSVAHGAAITAEMTATTGLTAAQLSFNASLLACPLTWIVIGIVAVIAAIYAGVAAFNKFTGASVSATGVVAAVFGVLAAHIYNNFVVPTWNVIAAFINFFYNVWNDPIAAVKVLFYDLASTVIGYVVNMAQAIEDVINSIPGVEVSITAGLKGFQGQIESAAAKAKSESDWKEIVSTKEFMDYSTAASKAYDWGANKESQIKNVFNGSEKVFQPDYGMQTMMGGMNDNLGKTAGNTGSTAADTAAIADQLDIVEEDLKYMRDAAEQEVINRFTLAELKIDVNNHNTLKTKTDFDDVNRMLGAATSEILVAAAEGGHI